MIFRPETSKFELADTELNSDPTSGYTVPVIDPDTGKATWYEVYKCTSTKKQMDDYRAQFANNINYLDTLTPEQIAANKAKAQAEIDWANGGA